MGRPADPQTQYRVGLHATNGYTYARTVTPIIDPGSGKKKYRYPHWGAVDDGLRFFPGNEFWLATPGERALLIFPEDWDLSAANDFSGLRRRGRPARDGERQNRLYGDIWLLEQVATKTGVREDLEAVFHGNTEIVDDLPTLAMFPYLTGFTYNRVVNWQKIFKAPSSRDLTPSAMTRLAQAVTGQNRVDLLKLRSARTGKGELCAVGTTSRSACGDSLADIKWGKSEEGLALPQAAEVVVYSLSSHMPVHCRTFPGNIPDSRALDIILLELGRAGFKNPELLTDRGFENLGNLEKFISRSQPMIMRAKAGQKMVLKAIEGLGEFWGMPEGMSVDSDEEICHKQHEIDYQIKGPGGAAKKAKRLRLNLHLNPVRRSAELPGMNIALAEQEASLRELAGSGAPLKDPGSARSGHGYFKLAIGEGAGALKGYERDERKVARGRRLSGLFAILTHGLDFGAMRTYATYRPRDGQEKRCQQMKTQMAADRQGSWSENGKTGRLLILFVSLVLGSRARHVWGSASLRELFSSSLEALDEMRPIRCAEHPHKAMAMTPFAGSQVAICEAFGIPMPEGCAPVSKIPPRQKRKRGRPSKKKARG
jgi:hypothetical protein